MQAALPLTEKRMEPRRLASFAVIVLLHLGFFYALSQGLMQHVSAIVPQVMYAVILPQEKAAEQPQAKTLPEPKKIVPPVEQVQIAPPVIDIAPAPSAIAQNTAPVRETAPAQPAAAPVPLAATQPATPKIVTGVEYLQQPQPVYPVASRRRNEEGVVQLRVLINETGRATQVEVVKSSDSPRLDEAARVAVLHALFKPYMENGRALPVYAIVPINFRLG